jgi:hypothetical protein
MLAHFASHTKHLYHFYLQHVALRINSDGDAATVGGNDSYEDDEKFHVGRKEDWSPIFFGSFKQNTEREGFPLYNINIDVDRQNSFQNVGKVIGNLMILPVIY